MVLSLAVVGVLVAFWIAVAPHSAQNPVKPISYQVELDGARRVAPYRVLAPVDLPPRWRATSVRFTAADPHNVRWHLGFIAPDEQYVAVEQTNGPGVSMVADEGQHGVADGQAEVNGVRWARYHGTYNSLARTQGEVTTLVTGTAGYPELVAFASALR
jgi:hypothetical protein